MGSSGGLRGKKKGKSFWKVGHRVSGSSTGPGRIAKRRGLCQDPIFEDGIYSLLLFRNGRGGGDRSLKGKFGRGLDCDKSSGRERPSPEGRFWKHGGSLAVRDGDGSWW